jgi:hypothetical protein
VENTIPMGKTKNPQETNKTEDTGAFDPDVPPLSEKDFVPDKHEELTAEDFISEEQRRIALDPNTPADKLASMFASSVYQFSDVERALSKYVIQNPNCPKDLLLMLGANHPMEMLKNPSFELFFLENPGLLKEMPYETRQALFQNLEIVPDWIIERMIQGYASWVARNLHTPVWAMRYLAKAKQPEIRGTLAHNANLPDDIIWDLSRDPTPYVRRGLSFNPKLPEDILANLANDQDTSVRSAVAGNAAINAEISWQLAQDPQPAVREGLARSPHTPIEVLEYLANDENDNVIISVAKNSTTPFSHLESLAAIQNTKIRTAIASNPQMRMHLLSLMDEGEGKILQLFAAPSPYQKMYWKALFSSGHSPKQERLFAKSEHLLARRIVAYCSSDIPLLEWLAKDPDQEVADEILLNPQAPIELMEECLQNKSHDEMRTLAETAEPPDNLVRVLAYDLSLRSYLMKNLSIPRHLVRTVYKVPPKKDSATTSKQLSLFQDPPKNNAQQNTEEIHEENVYQWEDKEHTQPPEPDDIMQETAPNEPTEEELASGAEDAGLLLDFEEDE